MLFRAASIVTYVYVYRVYPPPLLALWLLLMPLSLLLVLYYIIHIFNTREFGWRVQSAPEARACKILLYKAHTELLTELFLRRSGDNTAFSSSFVCIYRTWCKAPVLFLKREAFKVVHFLILFFSFLLVLFVKCVCC